MTKCIVKIQKDGKAQEVDMSHILPVIGDTVLVDSVPYLVIARTIDGQRVVVHAIEKEVQPPFLPNE